MYVIYQLVDPLTGEVVRYAPTLADQVAELRAARLTGERQGQAVQAIRGAGSAHSHRPLRLAPVDGDAEIWRLFQGTSL